MQFSLVELWPAGMTSLCAGSGNAVTGPFGDQPSLELGNRTEHMEDQLAGS